MRLRRRAVDGAVLLTWNNEYGMTVPFPSAFKQLLRCGSIYAPGMTVAFNGGPLLLRSRVPFEDKPLVAIPCESKGFAEDLSTCS